MLWMCSYFRQARAYEVLGQAVKVREVIERGLRVPALAHNGGLLAMRSELGKK